MVPTIAALANVPLPVVVDGESFDGWLVGSPPASWRTDFLIEHRRASRGDTLVYLAQITDGDRPKLFHGDPRAQPRGETIFEFDSGDGVSPGGAAADPNCASKPWQGKEIVARRSYPWGLGSELVLLLAVAFWLLRRRQRQTLLEFE